jgi:hypothetical protein
VFVAAVASISAAGAHGQARRGAAVPALRGSPNVCLPGLGSEGWCGDGGPATQARLRGPEAVAALPGGGFLVADSGNDVVRKVDSSGRISTVVGVGFPGRSRPRGLAATTRLAGPTGIVALPTAGYLIADTGNHVVVEVDSSGRIFRLAGTGIAGSSGDGGPASRASLRSPQGLAVAGDGSILIADPADNRVRRISTDGTIETIAGTGKAGYGGDGGPATAARLDYPTGVAAQADGGVLIADDGNLRVRRVQPNGDILTVAGGRDGSTPATRLALNGPTGVASTSDGGFVIADGPVVDRISPDGSAAVAAGIGKPIYTRPGPANSAGLADATAVAVAPDGSILIADDQSDRIREVDTSGNLITVAGSGIGHLRVTVGSSVCTNPNSRPPWDALDVRPWLTYPTAIARRPMRIKIETSVRAQLVVTVSRRARRIARRRGVFGSGAHTVALGRAPAPGSYDVSVSGRARINRRAFSNCVETVLDVRPR